MKNSQLVEELKRRTKSNTAGGSNFISKAYYMCLSNEIGLLSSHSEAELLSLLMIFEETA
jgi:hypothetical protein